MVFGWFPWFFKMVSWFFMVFGWFPWFFKMVSWFFIVFGWFSWVFCEVCGDNFGVSPNFVTFCASLFMRFLVLVLLVGTFWTL